METLNKAFCTQVSGDGDPYIKLQFKTLDEQHAAYMELADAIAAWNRRPTNEGQDGLTDEEILFEADNYALIYGGNRPELIGFARAAIERALNQRLAVKEGDGA